MLLLTVAIASVTLLAGALLYSRARPFGRTARCPSCDAQLLELPNPTGTDEHRTYDVLACPTCTNTSLRVQGAPTRFAWCPSCLQRTLEATARRLPPTPEAPLAVEIEERCHVCSHRAERIVPPPGQLVPRGQVIPFPGPRR